MKIEEAKQRLSDFARRKGYVGTPDELIAEVSKRYHDKEASQYEEKHPEIYKEDLPVYQRLLPQIAFTKPTIKVIDYGCGAGFEALQLWYHLGDRKNISLLCVDQSKKMLEMCERNLKDKTNWDISFSPQNYNTINETFDLVLTNSLVHHIFDVQSFLLHVTNWLQNDGYYLMGHEPNSTYYKNPACIEAHNKMESYLKKSTFPAIVKGFILKSGSLLLRKSPKPTIAEMVSTEMLELGRIKKPLNYFEVQALVDIHVCHPKSNFNIGYDGFTVKELTALFKGEMDLTDAVSYHFLGSRNDLPSTFLKLRNDLQRKYPRDGMNFSLLWHKKKGLKI